MVLLVAMLCSCKEQAAEQSARELAEAKEAIGLETTPAASVPDPQFPTARAAGSEGIFALEEPERGPLLTTYALPDTTASKPTWHGECEIDYHGVECAPTAVKNGRLWRVFRMAKAAVYESVSGERQRVVVELDGEGRATRMISIGSDGRVEWSRSYSKQGTRYTARWRSGANHLSGCGAMSLEIDDKGRATSATCLQWLGEPMRDQHGVVTTKVTRDKNGLVSKMEYFDKDGQPSSRHDGVHRVEIERNAKGQDVAVASFDADAKPVRDAATGCARQSTTYGVTGQVAAQRCLDGDGALSVGPEGYATAKHRRDSRGCEIETSFQGVDGKPMQSRFSAFGVQRKVDELCRAEKETCLNATRRPATCSNEKHATVEYQRDAAGNVTARRYRDAGGAPSGDPEYGVFEVRQTHDERGRTVSQSCFDASGGAVECANTGLHAAVHKHDDAGRVVSITYRGADGKPTSNLGTFEARVIYDNYDHAVEQQSLDALGEPVESLGSSLRRQIYDDGHRLFAVTLFQNDGEPASYRGCFTSVQCPPRPWHAVRVVRSASGAVTQNLFFDAKKQLIDTIECTSSKCFGIDREDN
jgi:hypothetical protein